MKSKKSDFVIVAHPDDETLFFGGLIQQSRKNPWEVICVTDGNADGFGAKRKRQFQKACRALGVSKSHWLGFPDVYENRLNVSELTLRLQPYANASRIFTHNILGEYGHPHHQDVSAAVHMAFSKTHQVFSTAYNAYPDKIIKLKTKEYDTKTQILTQIYSSETRRFTHLLPATWAEGFVRVSIEEVEKLYGFMVTGRVPSQKELKVFRWYRPYLADGELRMAPRPF